MRVGTLKALFRGTTCSLQILDGATRVHTSEVQFAPFKGFTHTPPPARVFPKTYVIRKAA